MIDQKWFSSNLRFAIFVDATGADTLNDCLFLFKANDFKSAFARALSIGKNEEKDYVNAQNKKVFWKFMEVLSLDVVGSEILDGAELYSEPVHLAENDRIPFAQFFFSSVFEANPDDVAKKLLIWTRPDASLARDTCVRLTR